MGPQAEELREILARAGDVDLAPPEVELDLLVARGLVRKIEIVDVAGLVLAVRHLDGGVRGLGDHLAHRDDLHRALQREIGGAGARGELEDVGDEAEAHLLELRLRDLLSRGEHEEVEEILRHPERDLRGDLGTVGGRAGRGEDRILQQARLDDIVAALIPHDAMAALLLHLFDDATEALLR